MDVDLARRQQQAEALLANIVAARPAQTVGTGPAATRQANVGATFAPSAPSLDQPWWAPDWARSPTSPAPDPTPRQVLGLPR